MLVCLVLSDFLIPHCSSSGSHFSTTQIYENDLVHGFFFLHLLQEQAEEYLIYLHRLHHLRIAIL